MRRVGNALTRRKGVGVFGSVLLRREGVRGFGFGIGCSGVIQMTRDGRRQVGTGRIGVGSVTVVTDISMGKLLNFTLYHHSACVLLVHGEPLHRHLGPTVMGHHPLNATESPTCFSSSASHQMLLPSH